MLEFKQIRFVLKHNFIVILWSFFSRLKCKDAAKMHQSHQKTLKWCNVLSCQIYVWKWICTTINGHVRNLRMKQL